ncbi:MAG TPA: phosphatase PAP2 family protein [Pirellulaceae bacterium]|nr:phosphatase PAP2 family protein [Pirellulaceae bacterium]
MWIDSEGRAGVRRAAAIAAALILSATVVAATLDMPVARFCRAAPTTGENSVPKSLRKPLALAEVFAHGVGVGGILVTMWLLDPARRRGMPRVVAASLGAGGLADVVKWVLVSRMRPQKADLDGSVWDTFVGLLPRWSGAFAERAYTREFQSCPSAHSAVAAGLAVVLSTLYPRGRWWFAVLAVLAMLQRVDAGAHFPSDTLLGAAVGCLVGSLSCHLRPAAFRLVADESPTVSGASAGRAASETARPC